MGFNLDRWKAQISEYFTSHAPLITQGGSDTLYGLLVAGALLPAIGAFHGGEMVPVITELTALLGGVGGNLLANLIQKWKDQTDEEIADEVMGVAPQDAELRKWMDELLQKLEVIKAVERPLTDEDKRWFLEALQANLKKVHSSLTINTGSGAVVLGNVVQGPGSTFIGGIEIHKETNIAEQNNYAAPDPEDQKRLAVAEARQRYLTYLRKYCQNLPLAALGGDEGSELGVTLDDVYIELDTTAFIEENQPNPSRRSNQTTNLIDEILRQLSDKNIPLPVLRAAREAPRMVLLGEPGAGKSTFVRKLVGWLAGAALKHFPPPEGFPADGLPLLINLRDLAPRLAGLKLDRMPAEKRQEKLVAAFTAQVQVELKIARAEDLQADLLRGLAQNGLLVLDGLDEVPFHLRALVRQAVFTVFKTYEPTRAIITCRIRSYQEDFNQSDFKAYTVKPLDKKKIAGFTTAWYRRQRELGRAVPQNAEDDLTQAATGDDLQELASNPMMLTTMAIIHQKQTRLPDQRVKLYKEAVEILLRRWQQHKQGELVPSEGLAQFLKDDIRLRPAMYRLAYTAHCAGCKNGRVADLPRGEALVILSDKKYLGDLNLAQEFLDYVDQRAGLLVGQGGKEEQPLTYSFPHRTFQEYLAGCYIAGLRDHRTIGTELWERAAEGVDWSLAARMAVEELYHNREDPNRVLDIAYWLREKGSMQDDQHQRAWLWAAQQTELVGREMIEADPPGNKHLDQIIPALVNLLGGGLTPIERAEAGSTLARLGDPRFRMDAFHLLDEPLYGFVQIPAGQFVMGSDPIKDQYAREDEQPQHKVELDEFYIARYPVTVAQFKAFVGASGHSPRDPDYLLGLPNHPVVNVTWYDALAYCDWLTRHLFNLPNIPPELRHGWRVTLPSEAEWERAARGTDGRIYPWGNEFDPDKANTIESGIGGTSSVGCFPAGLRPEKLLDASGNVGEWTRSLWGKDWDKPEFVYPYSERLKERENLEGGREIMRVARGGSWYNIASYVGCALRGRGNPDSRYLDIGFRVSLCATPWKGSLL